MLEVGPGPHQLALELAGADSLALELAPRPHQLALGSPARPRAGSERVRLGRSASNAAPAPASSPIISQIAIHVARME